jgi:hypothetical protein
MLRPSKWCLSFIFPHQNSVFISLLPHTVPCLSFLILLYLFTQIIFGEDYNLRSSSLCSFFKFPGTHLSWCASALARRNKRGGELILYAERAASGTLWWSSEFWMWCGSRRIAVCIQICVA